MTATGDDVKQDAGRWSFNEPAYALGYLLLGALLFFRVDAFRTRWFNPDEFVHMHASWCISEGGLPYRDFYVHHTPWLWYLLAPFVAGAGSDVGAGVHALLMGRTASLVLSVGVLGALVWLGRVWSGSLAGPVSALCLAGLNIFYLKTAEIRPDVPALLLWIGCLIALASALRADAARAWRWPFLAAGLCFGAALMFNQKMLMTLPGLGVAGLAWAVFASAGTPAARLRAMGWFLLGLCVPLAATWAFFAAHGAGGVFLRHTFLVATRWKAAEPREPWLQQLAADEWPVLLCAAGGIGVWLWGFRDAERRDWLGLVLVACATSLLLGLLVVPTAFAQYYLPLLPVPALFAARFLVLVGKRLPPRLRSLCLCTVLVLLQITPVRNAMSYEGWRNDGQLAQLAYVYAHSAPSDPVLDGFRGLGVFRPHAWHYYWLAADLRGMLPPETVDAFLDDLESGRVRPALVVADNHVAQLSPRLVAFVRTHYTYGQYDIWIRKPDA